jgi:glutathione S-transferase
MTDPTLYLGNKTYSSWSMRAWLVLRAAAIPFEEQVLPMSGPGAFTPAIRARSPSGRVPVLEHGELLVWDSLAIAEYAAELAPAARLWPDDRARRAIARSVAAEMHSGFTALRGAMPMNVRREPCRLQVQQEVHDDIARIVALWTKVRGAHGSGGAFLFGGFGIADAMYAPVATRFRTYGVTVEGAARDYVAAIHDHPLVREWIDAAKREPWTIEAYERVGT